MFYVVRNGKYHGPFSGGQIEKLKTKGRIAIDHGDRVVPASSRPPLHNSPEQKMRRQKKSGDFFDIGFNHMISVQFMTVLWVLWLCFAGMAAFVGEIIYIRASMEDAANVLMIPAWLFLIVLGTIGVRLWMEFIVVIFKIAEHTRRIK